MMLALSALASLASLLQSASPASPRPSRPEQTYAVGFRREYQLDHSRSWTPLPGRSPEGSAYGRPVRIDIWYPALPGCRLMTMRRYLTDPGDDGQGGTVGRLLEAHDSSSYQGFFTAPGIERAMARRTGACSRPAPAAGRFPVVAYSAGWYNRSPDNSVLAERLARQGFIVVTVPQLNPGLWTNVFRATPVAIETQVRDLEFALGVVLQRPNADANRIAAMGFSTGGVAALLLQLRNPRIRAVVALDPSFVYDEAGAILGSPYFAMAATHHPLMVLSSGNERFVARRNLRVVDSLHLAPRLIGLVGKASHGDFSDDVILEVDLSLSRPREPRSTAEGIAGYNATGESVVTFLRHVLVKESLPPMDSLPSLVRWQLLPAAGIPSSAEWVALAGTVTMEQLLAQADSLARAHPGLLIIDASDLNSAAYSRIRSGAPREAVTLFRLVVQAYPEQANGYDSLADGCLAAGDRDCVAGAYRRLIALLPGDTSLPPDVKTRLQRGAEDWLAANSARTPP